MSTAKEEVQTLLNSLPDDCSLEDIQYHLYVIEKVNNGLAAADSQGTISQEEVEERLGKTVSFPQSLGAECDFLKSCMGDSAVTFDHQANSGVVPPTTR